MGKVIVKLSNLSENDHIVNEENMSASLGLICTHIP